MRNVKLTFIGSIVLSGLFYANPIEAMTLIADSKEDFKLEQGYNGWYYGYDSGNGFQQDLELDWGEFTATGGFFNGQSSSRGMTRRWISDFEGSVKLGIDLSGNNNSGIETEFLQQISIDGKSILSETSTPSLIAGSYNLGIFDINNGSVIDFAFSPANQSWQGQFDLAIEIEGNRGRQVIDNLRDDSIRNPIHDPRIFQKDGLVFLNSSEGKAIHVGLAIQGVVYEANPNSGVQKQLLELFIKNKNYEFKEIPTDRARSMAAFIEKQLGAGYLFLSPGTSGPYDHKGYGGKFSNVGLIERAAEEALFRGGQGVIPNHLEWIEKDVFSISSVDFMRNFSQSMLCENSFTLLGYGFCGELEFDYPSGYFGFDWNPEKWFYGQVESTDFIVTDPLGRKMGYVSDLGFFNEIPDVVYGSKNLQFLPDTEIVLGPNTINKVTRTTYTTAGKLAPNSLSDVACSSLVYSPNDNKSVFRFSIDRRVPGEYKIEKRDPGNCTNERQSVPEPGAIAGLLTTLGLALNSLKSRRHNP